MGRRNNEGAFEPAISFVEAMQSVPEEELNVFIHLDNLYAKMEAQYIEQTKGKK